MNSKSALLYRRTLASILALISLNVLAAGYGFMGTPDGSAVGIPKDWLADTPFDSYMVPGAILFALGLLHLWAAYLQLRSDPIASKVSEIAGIGLVIWIAVQAAMMGSFRNPAQTILQAVCMVLGLVTIYLSSRQMTFRRHRIASKIQQRHPT
jgi:hypothetical protein